MKKTPQNLWKLTQFDKGYIGYIDKVLKQHLHSVMPVADKKIE